MDKNYNHKDSETKIYTEWENSGVFTPLAGDDVAKTGRKTFTIIMPPPNANDPLHVGHAMFVTIEDIFVRFHRMKGEAVLWLPGTDHAGIETQFVFEKKLTKRGKSRFDFDRETLYQMIWDYVHENSGVAIDQMKRLGASADWSRYKFTLDPEIVKEVKKNFFKLHEEGLVYRSVKLVNYCTKCGTAYSELEVDHEDKEDKLYMIRYGQIVVATTRPETMLGDVAVAVNPEDLRYKHLIGQKVILPLVGREIPIVGDSMVDMEFGTGAVKITPAHDNNDWEVAVRQGWNMDEIVRDHQIIGTNGKMTKNAGKYEGLSVAEAREKVASDLGEALLETKPYLHSVGTCYRCHRAIEPLPMKQFFVKVKTLADKALAALDSGETVILGSGHDKILRHWLTNLRDWNISRQIVWGIRMPVWYKTQNDDYVVSETSPGDGWVQETDTFDTWFSSGQWPVVTLETGKPGDFEAFYPTTVMETAYDILPFWVMRMMMLGIYMTGKSPFKTVYLHGLVRDEQGRKMSKSIGNVINPLELVEKYGADSLRMALVMSTTAGQDSNTGENKVRGMRNFANKIWNAGRYVQDLKTSITQELKAGNNERDDDFRMKIQEVRQELTRLLEENRVGLAAEYVYNEFWHWFCDVQIEENKQGKISDEVLKDGFKSFLVMLHPFVPFVTEAVWKEVYSNQKLLISEKW
ncbi:valine--tRNA ligase [Candidatus Collierbacteria bacterium RIFOXYB2_FULL_46_14]|uniref:Valine--tRNA ligase n=1 Tax=Candidatus Collierbacteria bacterium GW2011_GWA2_46_26 TaxID=1618381 RepID=A0A0G1RTM2_9BACT|nr:MAG: Valyl-tRNA synthetase [Candidatus Collierbacteria bacterium GW2011_GWC2_44_13]KKU33313.1 MAG: Valyl-tRNA synthetase [Candidatus Collierbacteria bacterium GW2011_GWA2_46_26]OGD72733.1 MAG: valine--tRNA ligase [Candidatus Collierbacteria bacterium RIFOXYB2_FULL_46_14]OGD75775.1 MAG: valine--tRNA ligase [Candidatus Collierbacteria bacterium RIFOXYA2_FULL_46_20]OGD77111.1 MAG: valine--tRNA ligase [Candidatus Collierbacteria bacterium RIFOXYC2_FULL_43_15]OGD80401.1 MAG: valine--tRNA ligase 